MGVFAAVILVGVTGYMVIERWSFFDALYMTVITVGAVGYREVHALTAPGQLFTMVLIIAGFGALIFAGGTLIDFMVEGHFTGLMEGRRMQRRIAAMSGHHVVAGMGRVGTIVAEEYGARGQEFVAVDEHPEALAAAKEAGWAYVEGDATEESVLSAAGLERAGSLVTALDTDADNLFVTLTARGMKPDIFIVARATACAAEGKLLRAGADRVITPTKIGGRRMAAMVLQPGITDYLDVVMHGENVELKLEQISLSPGDPFAGSSIGEAHVRSRTGVYVLAIRHADGSVDTNPSADTVMGQDDTLIVMGTEEQLRALAGWACNDPDVCYIPIREPGDRSE